jgi:hypothetical protein
MKTMAQIIFKKKLFENFDFVLLHGYQYSESLEDKFGINYYYLTGKMILTFCVDRENRLSVSITENSEKRKGNLPIMGLPVVVYMLSKGKTYLFNQGLSENQDLALKVYSKELKNYWDEISDIFTSEKIDKYYEEYQEYHKAMYRRYFDELKNNLSHTKP